MVVLKKLLLLSMQLISANASAALLGNGSLLDQGFWLLSDAALFFLRVMLLLIVIVMVLGLVLAQILSERSY